MNVLVIGANGQIGKQIIELAKEEKDIAVTAMVRKQEQLEAFQAVGTQAVLADLEGSVEHLQKAMEGIDAVVSLQVPAAIQVRIKQSSSTWTVR